jgi:Neutral/alkaline non-lysosomal ceramidase, N-terminal
MRKTLIITGVIISIIISLFFLGTKSVDHTSYLESDYYTKSCARIDSLENCTVIENNAAQAGFAKVSITPELNNYEDNILEGKFINVPLAGYGVRKGKTATGIHDSIFVKAIALRVNTKTIVFISTDLLIMPPNIVDSVMNILSKNGIRREQLLFSATHSHSSLGGWGHGYIGEMFAGEENKNLTIWLSLQISKAVTTAIDDLKPARIGSSCFNAKDYTLNRVRGESGTKNNDFCFIALEQIGYKKAILGSFSSHATTLGPENMEISADYPGYWVRKTEETYADMAMFFAGSTGSQGPVEMGEGFEKPKFLGESLADSIGAHLPGVVMNDNITFSLVSLKMFLPEYNIRLTTKTNLSSYLSNKLMPCPENVYLQAVRIDNMLWITTPCDFSGEYAIQIKHRLSFKKYKSNISGFNGSYVGYIVPGRYFYLNEYESKDMGWFGPNMGDYTVDLIHQISDIVTNTDNI